MPHSDAGSLGQKYGDVLSDDLWSAVGVHHTLVEQDAYARRWRPVGRVTIRNCPPRRWLGWVAIPAAFNLGASTGVDLARYNTSTIWSSPTPAAKTPHWRCRPGSEGSRGEGSAAGG